MLLDVVAALNAAGQNGGGVVYLSEGPSIVLSPNESLSIKILE